jgi:hypothetical protein
VLASTFFSLVILACIELDNTGSLCAAVIGACLLGVTLLSCRVAGLKALTGQPALLQLSNSLELPSTLVTALHFLKAQSNGSNDSGSAADRHPLVTMHATRVAQLFAGWAK